VEYLSPKAFGKQQNPPMSQRRVSVLCNEGRIPGAIEIKGIVYNKDEDRQTVAWAIPADAVILNRDLKRRKKEV
jgi:hypothetical protein